jgi:hypothetical protein
MSDSSFNDYIIRERERLQAEREQIFNQHRQAAKTVRAAGGRGGPIAPESVPTTTISFRNSSERRGYVRIARSHRVVVP